VTPELYQQAEQIFIAVADLPTDQQAALIAQRAAGDQDLTALVELLLKGKQQARAGILDVPITELASRIMPPGDPPQRIGRYERRELLGEGGMGVVYRAEDPRSQRSVALKLVRATLSTSRLHRRFQSEVQAMSRLEHDNIARLYDVGAFEVAGMEFPFFAMELVHGEPVTVYADKHGLNLRQRLNLFLTLCDAVEFAHTRRVLHCDLKPGNLLVTADGRLKVLDFGISEALSADGQRSTTGAGWSGFRIPFTPNYASPEQFEGSPARLDPRSDVYALGVILFELLAGRVPLELESLPLGDALAKIRSAAPPRLGAIRSDCRGDLETIVHRALEKSPDDRFATASELAAQLRLHLDNKPLTIRPTPLVERVRKRIRRNRTALVVAGAIILGLLGLLAGTVAGELRANESRKIAEQQATRTRQTASIMAGLIRNVTSAASTAHGDLKPVLDASRRELDRIEGDFPDVTPPVRAVLGSFYNSEGYYVLAEQQLRRALSGLERFRGANDPDTARAAATLAIVLRFQGDYDGVYDLAARYLHLMPRQTPGQRREALLFEECLASTKVLDNRVKEAEPVLLRLLEEARALEGESSILAFRLMDRIALCHAHDGRLEEADRLFAEQARLVASSPHQDHVWMIASSGNHAEVLRLLGRLDEAEELQRRCYTQRTSQLGPEHAECIESFDRLARVLADQGRYGQAEVAWRRCITAGEQRHGNNLGYLARARLEYGRFLAQRGRLGESLPPLIAAHDYFLATSGPDRPLTRLTLESLSQVLAGPEFQQPAAQ